MAEHTAERDASPVSRFSCSALKVNDEKPSAEKDAGRWTRLTKIQAAVTFECACGGVHEFDVAGAECDGTTSVEWKCDDCGSPLLVYVDVDARVRVTPPGVS